MTVYKSNKVLAYRAAGVVIQLVEGKNAQVSQEASTMFFEVPVIFEEPELMNHENLIQVCESNGLYTKEELLTDN